MMARKPGLTAKQRLFAEEYLKDLNAGAAAARAGYSPATAETLGCRLLTKPHVQAALQEKMDQRSRRTEIDADWVLERLARIADLDIRQLFDNGRLRPIDELPKEVATAISSIDLVRRKGEDGDPEYVAKLRAWDKVRALELMQRHLGVPPRLEGDQPLMPELSEEELMTRLAQKRREAQVGTQQAKASGAVVPFRRN